jgi:long-chain acyl-CoA synthetase
MTNVLSIEVSGTLTDQETPVRRNAKSKDKLVTQPFEGIDTVTDCLFYAARTHGAKDAFGTREVLDVHEEEKTITKKINGEEKVEKKKWKYFELGPYQYLSFQQVKTNVIEIANAFVELGMKKGDVFNIYAQTRCVKIPTCYFLLKLGI